MNYIEFYGIWLSLTGALYWAARRIMRRDTTKRAIIERRLSE